MIRDKFGIKGSLELELRGPDGKVKQVLRKDNIIVTVGFNFIGDAIGNAGARPGVMSHIAVGTGTTAPAIGNTTLETELDRNAATYAQPTDTSFTFTATFAPGDATGAITEAGVLNASSAGILFDRVTFSVINKGADDTLTTTFTFNLS